MGNYELQLRNYEYCPQQVRRKGFRTIIKSFDTKKLAQKWARGIEMNLL